MRKWLALLLLTMSVPAYSHDKYHELKNKIGGSCCTDTSKECRPVRALQNENGQWLVYISELSIWHPVEARQHTKKLPDERCHACYIVRFQSVSFYCFTPCDIRS